MLAVADDVAEEGDCILFEPDASDVFEPIRFTGVADLSFSVISSEAHLSPLLLIL